MGGHNRSEEAKVDDPPEEVIIGGVSFNPKATYVLVCDLGTMHKQIMNSEIKVVGGAYTKDGDFKKENRLVALIYLQGGTIMYPCRLEDGPRMVLRRLDLKADQSLIEALLKEAKSKGRTAVVDME